MQVAQTCQLALQRIQHFSTQPETTDNSESRYLSVDPTPAAPASTPTDELKAVLLDEDARVFDRYCAMFGLRNQGSPEAVQALTEAFSSKSALLKHELAYVLGQMQDAAAVDALK